MAGYDGFHSKEAVDSLSCLIRASMLERVRRLAGSSATLVGYLTVERLSALASATPCLGPSDTSLSASVAGAGVGFILISASS